MYLNCYFIPNRKNLKTVIRIPLKVCRGTRNLLCSQDFWCTGVKIGPGASFADTINLSKKLYCHHVAQNVSPLVLWPILDCHFRANLQSKLAYARV